MFLIIVDVLASSAIPHISKYIIVQLGITITSSLYLAVLLLGFFWIIEKTIMHIQEIIFFPVINTTIRDLTHKVVHHVHSIPLTEYQNISISELMNAIRRISMSARTYLKIIFLLVIPTVFKLLVTGYVVVRLGLLGTLAIPLLLLAGIGLFKGTRWYIKAREEAWNISDNVIIRVQDSLLNTKVTRLSFQAENVMVKNLLQAEAAQWQTTNTRLHLIHILFGGLLGFAMAIILLCALFAIQNKSLTIGDFILLKAQLLALFLPLRTLSVEFRQLIESVIDIKKIMTILKIPNQSEISQGISELYENDLSFFRSDSELSQGAENNEIQKQQQRTVKYSTHKGSIKEDLKSNEHFKNIDNQKAVLIFNNVSFFHGLIPVIKNVSAQFKKGDKIGIMGESGSGKSTFLQLITTFYKPASGEILIHNENSHELSFEPLKRFIYFIPQDFRLFNMSLQENLTYGIEAYSDNDFQTVIKVMGLETLIQTLPEGLQSKVGEMGIKLSGGEKQKIALARAILSKPKVLLLDETTHSLDEQSEQKILQYLLSNVETVIIASHKPSTLKRLESIFKLENGQLHAIDKDLFLRNDPSKLEPFHEEKFKEALREEKACEVL